MTYYLVCSVCDEEFELTEPDVNANLVTVDFHNAEEHQAEALFTLVQQ